jgi:hypothetical protein
VALGANRRNEKSAVDLLPAPAEEGLPAFCFSAREGLGAFDIKFNYVISWTR